MKSPLVLLATTGVLALAPTPAQADFPEQPNGNVSTACAALVNTGTLLAGGFPAIVGDGRASDVAEEINGRNYLDACFGF